MKSRLEGFLERWRHDPVYRVGDEVRVSHAGRVKTGVVVAVVGVGRNPLKELARAVFGGGRPHGRVNIRRRNLEVRGCVSYIVRGVDRRGRTEYVWPRNGELGGV